MMMQAVTLNLVYNNLCFLSRVYNVVFILTVFSNTFCVLEYWACLITIKWPPPKEHKFVQNKDVVTLQDK